MAQRFTIPAASKVGPSPALALRVLTRDNFACVYCGAAGVALAVDHVKPRAHFEASAPAAAVNDPANLVTACNACNGAKGPQNLQGFCAMLRGRGVAAKDIATMQRSVRAATRRNLP